MKVAVLDPDPVGRGDLVAWLRQSRVAVVAFSEPRTALLFLLARGEELDGVLVNDDQGEWSAWLRRRLEIISAALPVASYSGRHPDRQARLGGEPIDRLADATAVLGALGSPPPDGVRGGRAPRA